MELLRAGAWSNNTPTLVRSGAHLSHTNLLSIIKIMPCIGKHRAACTGYCLKYRLWNMIKYTINCWYITDNLLEWEGWVQHLGMWSIIQELCMRKRLFWLLGIVKVRENVGKSWWNGILTFWDYCKKGNWFVNLHKILEMWYIILQAFLRQFHNHKVLDEIKFYYLHFFCCKRWLIFTTNLSLYTQWHTEGVNCSRIFWHQNDCS